MILDQTGKSGWNWRQSAMVTVDKKKKEVIYNPHFYAVKHYSHFIEPGARRIGTTGGHGP
eukprot:gene12984-4096_t